VFLFFMGFDAVVDSLHAALAAVPEGETTEDDDCAILIALLGVTSETPVTLGVNALRGLAIVLQVLVVVMWAPRSSGLRVGAGVTRAVSRQTTC
jgi:hypothetical protein